MMRKKSSGGIVLILFFLVNISFSCTVVRYQEQDQWNSFKWGVVQKVNKNSSIIPLSTPYRSTKEFFKNGGSEEAKRICSQLNSHNSATRIWELVEFSEVNILSPVTGEGISFLCQGLNYQSHKDEFSVKSSKLNILFYKAPSSLTGAFETIKKPPHVKLLDYEVELGVVIAKDITSPRIFSTAADLYEFIGGFVIVNDVSARDIQLPEEQWSKGKSYKSFGPTGPYLKLFTLEELDRYLNDLELQLWVNGNLRQSSNTKLMLNSIADTLSELSFVQEIKAGDLLATGTPGGVAVSSPPLLISSFLNLILDKENVWGLFVFFQSFSSRYLQHGDVVEAWIGSSDGVIDLGKQRITIEDDTNPTWNAFESRFVPSRSFVLPLVFSLLIWSLFFIALFSGAYYCGRKKILDHYLLKKPKDE